MRHLRHTLALVACTAVASAGVFGITSAFTASADVSTPQTIVVHGKFDQEAFRRENPDSPNLEVGDTTVASENLFQHGKKVGFSGILCTFTHVRPPVQMCTISYKLHGGEITAQAVLPVQRHKAQTFKLAITGGTGTYKNVRGYLTLEQINGGDVNTFHLQP